jgi:transposase InsO family protein
MATTSLRFEDRLDGASNFLSWNDDFSRKTWIFFMKTKDEVFNQFWEFKAQVENQTGKRIKVLRLDNGGEYTSNDFKDFCKEAGIKRELTVSYNPQQNGVVERKNRSIIGSARAMKDAQEHVEAPRSTFRESRPLKKFPNFMALMSNVIEEATNQQVYQDAMMEDDVWDIVPGSEGQPVPGGSSRSTFLAKREC